MILPAVIAPPEIAARAAATSTAGEPPVILGSSAHRRVSEVMTWSLLTVDAATSCSDTRRLAGQRHVAHVPVMWHGHIDGIVCLCDLARAPDGTPVACHMHRNVVSVRTSTPSWEAAALMRAWDVGSLPVLFHGFLVGIVTEGDLARSGVLEACARPACRHCGSHHHVRQTPRGFECLACFPRELEGVTP